jgi:2-polyprenyl-3-methyl-5-hydroxy-6-metoxy-1,4-benzoquinol methylase
MHPSVMDFLRREISKDEIEGKDLLEVGAQDVNGSPREVLSPHHPAKYIGVDFASGRGVDLVMNVKDLTSYFGPEAFDVVISTEMLEHAQDWRTAIDQMKGVLRPNGLLVVTTRSPGFPYHGYPHDYWRYTLEDFRKIFADFDILKLVQDPSQIHPGVFLKARKRSDAVAVDLSMIEISGVS